MGEKQKIFGKELIMDLYDCNPETLRSKEKILEFSNNLCDLIKMKKYGDPLIEKFGFGSDYTAGYSLVQLIETSAVSGHFSELWNRAYINIFSCKVFDDKIASDFTQKFFEAKRINKRVIIR